MAQKKRVNTVRLQNLSYGHKQSAALRAAVEPDSAPELIFPLP